jgi:hypothetical protein
VSHQDANEDKHRYRLGDAIAALREKPPKLGQGEKAPIPGSEADRESVAWMVDEAGGHLEEQHARLDSIQLRGGQLAGFAGILLGLLASSVPDGFSAMAGFAKCLAIATFVMGQGFLLTAILISLLFVVRPTRFWGISPARRVDSFLKKKGQFGAERWKLQLAKLRGYPDALRWHAWVNRRKAAALFVAYLTLAIGLLASAVCLGTIGVDSGPQRTRSSSGGGIRGEHSGGNGLVREGHEGPKRNAR